MALSRVMFSSDRDDWETPQDFFDRYDALFHFTLDPASSDANAKCEKHYTTAEDGLSQNWGGAFGMAQSSLRQRDR